MLIRQDFGNIQYNMYTLDFEYILIVHSRKN